MKNFKKIMKLLFTTKVLVIVLILIFLLAVLLPASYYFITIDDAMWDKEEKGRPSNYTQNVEVSTDNEVGGLTVDKSTIIKQALMDLGYTEDEIANFSDKEIIEILGLNKKIKGENDFSTLDDVTAADVLWCMSDAYSKYLKTPEELEKLLNAEIITQYPKMGQDDAELDGIIQFERHKTDGTTEMLSYIDKDTFSSYVQGNDTKALDYFTLDDQGNVMVAYSNSTTETVTADEDININDYSSELREIDKQSDGTYKKETITVEAISINYKMAVQKYTMPFQYLWSLLVVGEDRKFVLELADLIENSEITISIYDNVTTIEDVNTYKYKKETRTDKLVNLFVRNTYGVKGLETQRYWLSEDSPEAKEHYNSKYKATYEKGNEEYTVTHTKTTKTNSVVYDLTKANVWIVDYSKEYSEAGDATPTVESNSVELENTDYILNSDNSKSSDDDKELLKDKDAVDFSKSVKEYIEKQYKKKVDNANNTSQNDISDEIEADVEVSRVEIKKYEHKVERKQDNTVTTTAQKYVAQTPTNRPKVEKDADEDNFVTLLCKKSHKKAKKLLTGDVTSWLFEVLEKNEDTVDKVDLTKYLFYKVTGKDYGVTEYDFGEYADASFIEIGGDSANGTISLTTPVLNREQFISAMNSYSAKLSGNKKTNFDNNFLKYAGDIYDWSLKYGVNPELVIITAGTEQSFKAGGGNYNYWGIGVQNGSSTGYSFNSLEDGVKGYADVIKSFQTGSKASTIKSKAEARKALGVDPLGYGSPDTLSGMQSYYSYLGKHVDGGPGAGGYYFMDPAVCGVTKIYKTHEEFLEQCKNSGKAEHAHGTETTEWEQGQYTAYQVEQKIKVWTYIFGEYGSLSGGNEGIVELAKTKLGCAYVFGTQGPNTFDCSGLVEWVYRQKGISVPRRTEAYKDYSENEIDWSEVKPGDVLIIYQEERSGNKSNGHAAIYLGDDQYIHASQPGDVVKISSGAKDYFRHVFRFK